MMTKFAKIMVVFVTTASLSFLGVAIAIRNTGPSWREETQNLPDYGFTLSTGENPQWSSQYRTESAPLGSSASLPDMIAKSYDDGTRRNQEKVDEITPQIQPIADRITQMQGFIQADEQGLKKREEQLSAALKQIEQDIQNVSLAGERFATQAVDIRADAERTRESGMRLSRQRQQIETEQYRLIQEKKMLLDLIFQMEGIVQRLRDREQQLIDRGATPEAAAPAAGPSTT